MTIDSPSTSTATRVAELIPGGAKHAAERLGVSPESFERWCVGKSRPRPRSEGDLRRLLKELEAKTESEQFQVDQSTRSAVHSCLAAIREALHRRGRLSSRNEALDEVASLLFAHAVSIADGGPGISRSTLADPRKPASSLRQFVESNVERSLPKSLGHEIGVAEFALRLKSQEDELANDIINAFERLSHLESTSGIAGPDGVDVLNEVFGQFLADSFIDEKELGQYLTPPEVVAFMVRLALRSMTPDEIEVLGDPDRCGEFGYVLDPSCGAGSFLSEFLRDAHRYSKMHGDVYSQWLKSMSEGVLVGIDKSERMVRLALANLAIFGTPAVNLHLENSLSRTSQLTSQLEGSVGLILTNPPFGASFSRDELDGYRMVGEWCSRTPPSVDSEILFMERYLDWLKPSGQLVVVVPDSVLTNKGLFSDLRSGLSRHVDVLSVTSLPPVTFASAGTSTKTSVLQLRKRHSSSSSRTQFAICNDIGYSVSTKSSKRTKQHSNQSQLPTILDEMTSDSPPQFVRIVEGLTKYARWDATYHASLPRSLALRLATPNLEDVFVKDVAVLANDRVDPRRRVDPDFMYIEISDVDSETGNVSAKIVPTIDAPSRARQLVRSGDVLVSTVRPERGVVGVVPSSLDGAICTTGFAVLRPTQIESLTLASLLRSPVVTAQLLRNNVGIAYPAIESACLTEILLPIERASLTRSISMAEQVKTLQDQLDAARTEFEAIIEASAPSWAALASSEMPDVID